MSKLMRTRLKLACTLLYSAMGINLIRVYLELEHNLESLKIDLATLLGIQIGIISLFILLIFLISRKKNFARVIFLFMFIISIPIEATSLPDVLETRFISGVLGIIILFVEGFSFWILFTNPVKEYFQRPERKLIKKKEPPKNLAAEKPKSSGRRTIKSKSKVKVRQK